MNLIKKFYLTLLRDYYAGQAINMWYIDREDLKEILDPLKRQRHDIVANFNFDLADAMIKERSDRNEK